jgi:hypothetical protein
MIEVEGREFRADLEVVTVPRCPGTDALEHRSGLLIEGQAGHSLLLILLRDRGLSRSGWTAHEDDPSHKGHYRSPGP